MTYVCLLLIIQIIILPVYCIIEVKLIENYFSEKAIKSATVFGCFSKNEQVGLAKMLMSETRQVSVLNLNRFGVDNAVRTNHRQVAVVLDGDCSESEDFLITSGRLGLFDVKHHWLILSTSQVYKKFEKVILNINADIHLALKDGENQNWTISDIYNPAFEYGGSLNYTKIGYYDETRGYKARIREAKYWRRRNMTGVTFHTIVVFLDPFEGTFDEYLYNEDKRTANTYARFQHKLLRFCRDYYNFTLITESEESWGYSYPNGSFDGMVGALERRQIQFGSCPIRIREDRERVIDYGRNTWSWKTGFLFRSPKSPITIERFFKPLSTSIWLITGFFAILSIMILKIVTTFEKKRYHNNIETSWSLSFIFTLGAFCQQGSSSVPKMACGRVTVISIFLLSVIIYQFYSASLVSNLLMKPTDKIKNIKDLVESSLKVGCEDIIYNKDLFEHTTDYILKQLYYKKIYGKGNTSHFLDTEQGLTFVRGGGYAFHIDFARAYPIIDKTFSDQAICELREVKLFTSTDLYSTYQKNSPFYDMLETCFQRLAEHGILFREKTYWHPRKPECIQSSQSLINFHVGLEEFYPALLLLLFGIVGSLIVLIAERRSKLFGGKVQHSHRLPFTN